MNDPRPLADSEARRRIAEELDRTLFVEAAAGTGKTTALVGRMIGTIQTGKSTLDRMVAVTFTEKAAGEMKLRLREEIERARRAAPDAAVARRFDGALEHLELARIGTIHAFCAELLRERPVEAGVDPLFEVMPEDESEQLLGRAFDGWFEHSLKDPPAGLRRMLRRRSRTANREGPREQLRTALRNLVLHRDFPARWQDGDFDRKSSIDDLVWHLGELAPLAARAQSEDDWLRKNLLELAELVAELRLRESGEPERDYDGLEAELRELVRSGRIHWHWQGSLRRAYAPDLPRETVLARRKAVKDKLDAFVAEADAHLAAALREELREPVARYEHQKQRAGKLDFLDLLVKARDLVREDATVRAGLQARFDHFYVDEFQDTDPLQAELLILLAADDPREDEWEAVSPVPGKLFLVGDPKQSIYRFRRADIGIYEAAKVALCAKGAQVLHLTASFRSVPAIQTAINAVFTPLMPQGSPTQARYVALEPVRPPNPAQPAVIALPVPRPYGDYGTVVKWKIEESLPDAVGALLAWLIERSGWTVLDKETGVAVALAPRHVCLLFRRFKQFRDDATRPYTRALEARGIAHVLVGGHSFHEREEVLAIRNAICAIEWPDDELRVFATLRGPLFGIGDDALLAYRHRFRSVHPLRRHEPGDLDASEKEVAEALALLADLHRSRNRRPIADTISRFLDAVRAHAGVAIWRTGDQALANCLRVIDLARRFERGGAPSFRAFAERLEQDAERGESREAPLVEDGTEGVRIMTVHKAKGLEFPIVVLADPTCRATSREPSRHVDPARGLWAEPLCGCVPRDLLLAREEELRRDHEEAVRLAYVAATRARDLLVVPVIGDAVAPAKDTDGEGWLEMLDPAVYPAPAARRNSLPHPACPDFGVDSVLERPRAAKVNPADAVAPGRHRPQAGDHEVVWWDPRALELGKHVSVGLRQTRILEADSSNEVAEAGRAAHARWHRARERRIEQGSLPSLRVRSVTALSADEPLDPARLAEVSCLEIPGERTARPHGARFGTLVHATLSRVDLAGDSAHIRLIAAAQAKLINASEDEVRAASEAVQAALRHPVLRQAAGAARCYRETPIVLRRGDRSLIEGIIDLVFKCEDAGEPSWTVVDFKTDRDPSPRIATYAAQVRLYVEAVAAATGEKTRGVLLAV